MLPVAAAQGPLRGLAQAGPRVVVIGAGAFGGWTALELRRRGARVTLIDAWGPGNSRASSGGETGAPRRTAAGGMGGEMVLTRRRSVAVVLVAALAGARLVIVDAQSTASTPGAQLTALVSVHRPARRRADVRRVAHSRAGDRRLRLGRGMRITSSSFAAIRRCRSRRSRFTKSD